MVRGPLEARLQVDDGGTHDLRAAVRTVHALEREQVGVAHGGLDLELSHQPLRAAPGHAQVEADSLVQLSPLGVPDQLPRLDEVDAVDAPDEVRKQVGPLDHQRDVPRTRRERVDEPLEREDRRLVLVRDAVVVVVLVAVEDAVSVRVRVVRVGPEEALLDVVEAVVVLVERGRCATHAPRTGRDAEAEHQHDHHESGEEGTA